MDWDSAREIGGLANILPKIIEEICNFHTL
jgi:hypothetical protein